MASLRHDDRPGAIVAARRSTFEWTEKTVHQQTLVGFILGGLSRDAVVEVGAVPFVW